jgi:hypothetical protein
MRRSSSLIETTAAGVVAGTVLAASCVLLAQGAQQGGRGAAPAPAPAAAKPSPPAPVRDMSGVWMKRNPPGMNLGFTGFTFTDPKTSPPPLSAWGMERYKGNKANNSGEFTLDQTNDPVLTKCYPPGVPRVYFHPYPFEFIQTPKAMLQVFEYDHFMRRMWTDGRALPEDPDLLWMGTSVGRWVDDYTFEVVTVGLNTKTWIDRAGTPHSDKLKVTERFRRVDRDHLTIDFTMEDPVALTKPWTSRFYYELRPMWEIGEISCSGDYLDWAAVEK